MARRTGAYESLIRGVSQQVPHDRLPGQHWAQDNFISDPVHGVARRHGSVMVSEAKWSGVRLDAATAADARAYKETTLYVGGKEISLLYRSGPKPAGSTMPSIIVVDKETGRLLPAVGSASDTSLMTLLDKGISSITTVGQFIVASVEGHNTTYTQTDAQDWGRDRAVVWIKGGTYSRTYRITVARPNALPQVVVYTTPASYYQGTLDTSDIPIDAPDYQKQVNDRVNAYNTAVNQHLANAAAAIQPGAIAGQLRTMIANLGYTTEIQGSCIMIYGVESITVDDSGNGDFMKVAHIEVDSLEALPPRHLHEKVIRITPQPQPGRVSPSYYVRARAQQYETFPEVVWEEAAGVTVTPTFVFLIGHLGPDSLRMATTPAFLQSLTGLIVPKFESSVSGDLDDNPLPEFFGKPIDHVRTFQDRLMLISGSSIFLSKSGDYFNFFRKSVLSLADDDPIELYAEGSEGDRITESVQNERSLFLFGNRQQYVISGSVAITPTNAFCTVQSAHERANEAPPASSGNLIFFTQPREGTLTLQQMQTGAFADSFESFDVTTQLDGYVHGAPRQIVALTSPQQVFVRTAGLDNGIFVYTYLDTHGTGERLYDSWSRWTWSPALGQLVGLSEYESRIHTVTLRDDGGGTARLVLDRFSRDSKLADYPYLDSRRPYVGAGSTSIRPGWHGRADTAVVLSNPNKPAFLQGRPLDEANLIITPENQADAQIGTMFESSVTLTSPYIRDYKDRPILDGRLVIGKLSVTVADSAAMRAESICRDRTTEVLNWVHRPAGRWVLDTQQIAESHTVTVPVMKEIRDYRMRLKSRNWLPLTLSAIEWVGQFFSTRRR